MSFYPTAAMRYTAALRDYIHRRITVRGFGKGEASRLRKILIFEAMHFANIYTEKTDVYRVFENVFVKREEKDISRCVSNGGKALFGIYTANRRILEITLCSLYAVTEKTADIRIYTFEDGVLFCVCGVTEKPNIYFSGVRMLYCKQNRSLGCFVSMKREQDRKSIVKNTEYPKNGYSVFDAFSFP